MGELLFENSFSMKVLIIMFFELRIKRRVVLQPHQLCSGVYFHMQILTQLLNDLKALKCDEDHGYYVAATTIENIDAGKVRCHTGAVVFPTEFNCIVFKPFVGEIIEAEVKKVLKRGCFLACGPLEELFLHVELMQGYQYQQVSEGSGKFRNAEGSEIQAGTILRVKILGLKWSEDQRGFSALVSMNGDYLGVIDDPEIR